MKHGYTFFFAFIVLLTLSVAAFLMFGLSSNSSSMPASSQEQQEEAQEAVTPPESVVDTFMLNTLLSAPPQNDPQARVGAYETLTPEVRAQFDSPEAFHPGRFLGIQDVPDEGYTITTTESYPSSAEGEEIRGMFVTTALLYSGGAETRIFYLTRKDAGSPWRIEYALTPEKDPENTVR